VGVGEGGEGDGGDGGDEEMGRFGGRSEGVKG
jgi:hypothetical protein